MKTKRCLFVVLSFLSCMNPTRAQISTIHDYYSLRDLYERDSVAKIERQAALNFHEILNAYRLSKGVKAIEWNEVLWIASRNHCIWMGKAKELSHTQEKNTPLFTGSSPGERYNYAAGGSSTFGWSGENALYNFSAYGSNIKEISRNIAQSSFEQWKNSPGHHQNMLGSSHGMHGVAFVIHDHTIWGTDLFASCRECPGPTEEIASLPYKKTNSGTSQKTSEGKTSSEKHNKTTSFNSLKAQKELVASFMKRADTLHDRTLKPSPRLTARADASAKELLHRKFKSDPSEEVLMVSVENENRTLLQKIITPQKSVFNVVIEKDVTDFHADLISDQLADLITTHLSLRGKKKKGIAVALRKKKNKVRVAMVGIFV